MPRGMHLGNVLTSSINANPKKIGFDGKYLWITSTSGIVIYEWFATNTVNDGTKPMSEFAVNSIKSISLSNADYVEKGGDFMWVTSYVGSNADISKFNRIHKVSIKDQTIVETYKTPLGSLNSEIRMNSNLHFCEGKLWMVENYDESASTGMQKAWVFDTSTGLFSSITLEVKAQKARADIGSCSTGFVYLTSYNNLSVSKINATTNAFVSTIRGNAFPSAIVGTPNRTMLVASFGGLLSVLNSSDTFNHGYSSDAEAVKVQYQDTNTFWTLDGAGKIYGVKTNNTIISNAQTYLGQDYGILSSTTTDTWNEDLQEWQGGQIDLSYNMLNAYSISITTVSDIFVTPEFKYKRWDGTSMVDITMHPRLCLISGNNLYVINTNEIKFCFDRPEVKRSSISISGKAMVSFGTNNYLGEKG